MLKNEFMQEYGKKLEQQSAKVSKKHIMSFLFSFSTYGYDRCVLYLYRFKYPFNPCCSACSADVGKDSDTTCSTEDQR